MEFETILYERRERTACITLNRPDKLNAIDHTMIRELGEAYRAAETDEEVWTLIVTGAGRALCSGADVATVEQPKPGMDTRGEPLLGSYWQWNASAEATPRMRIPLLWRMILPTLAVSLLLLTLGPALGRAPDFVEDRLGLRLRGGFLPGADLRRCLS